MSVQSHDPLIGRRFGSYVIERLLGAGGMGAVYQAVQPEIGKRVAIKFLSAELAADAELVQRFFAEARAVNLIEHENIVDIFDFRTVAGFSYFVMELLDGASLATTLGSLGKLPVGRAVEIGVQVAAALAAAHARKVIHRDIKPDNIHLIKKAGYADFVKVLDFGIAKLAEAARPSGLQTAHGMVMGTPGYMSPEQATASPVDERSDVYSLGVVLFRALAGRLPFTGFTPDAVIEHQLTEKPLSLVSLRPEVPPRLAELIMQMIERDPARRPQTMREVQERLVACLAGYAPTPSGQLLPVSDGWRSVPPTQTPSGQRHTEPPARGRHPLLVGLVALASAAAVLIPVWLWERSHDHPPPAPAVPPAVKAKRPEPPPPPPSPVKAEAPPPAKKRWSVRVESDPPGAEIFDGERLLGTTPLDLFFDGPRKLRLHLDRYRDRTIDVDGDTGRVSVPLKPQKRPTPRGRSDGNGAPTAPGLGLND